MSARTNEYRDRFEQLKSERMEVVEAKWKDIAEYFCPERGRFETSESEPDRAQTARGSKILDETGQYAMAVCVNGMYSQLSSPVSKWFRLAFEDPSSTRITRLNPGWQGRKRKLIPASVSQTGTATSDRLTQRF